MKFNSKVLSLFTVLFLLVTLLVSCDLFAFGDPKVDIQATLATINNKASPQSKGASVSVNLSPTKYKMAITYFALVKDDGTEVIVTERDDSDPLIVNLVIRPQELLLAYSRELACPAEPIQSTGFASSTWK